MFFDVFFNVIGKCSYYIKVDAQIRARNKSCAAGILARESMRSTLLFLLFRKE